MEHQTTTETHTTAFTPGNLDRASDAQLEDLIKQAEALHEKREAARKREVIAQMQALAKSIGMNVTLEPKNTKKGKLQRRKAAP